MQKEKYIIIPNKKDLSFFVNNGFNSFILPLKEYSLSYDEYFSVEEINELSNKYNIYVLINRFLHNKINEFKAIYKEFNSNIKFIVEDIGLFNIIDKNRLVLYENHILSNYKAINYLSELDIKDVVINNDLTYKEIEEIRKNTKSNLYYFIITRNMLMYSKRKLISNYNEHYKKKEVKKYTIVEDVSKEKLMVEEFDDGTVILNSKIFIGNKHLDILKEMDYLIINTSSMSELETKIAIENFDNDVLGDYAQVDDYFLNNDIKYKVGDLS